MTLNLKRRMWAPTVILSLLLVVIATGAGLRTEGLIAAASQAQHDQEARLALAHELRGLAESQAGRVALAKGDAAEGAKAAIAQGADHLEAVRAKLVALAEDADERAALDKLAARAETPEAAAAAATAVDTLITVEKRRSDALRERIGGERMHTVYSVAAVFAVVVAALGFSTIFLVRTICLPLVQLAGAAERIGQGDLTVDVNTGRRDEIGDVMQAVMRMRDNLRELVGEVQLASDSIHTASREVSMGNTDLSQRTERTAGHLQQTASGMESLAGTMQHSAAATSQANQLATSASDVARRGGTVVSQVVSTMNDIHASSKKISDIIGVIDGIAFQTNILALNAAVEAARAGEQGRGFAVVASEVRSLAQRSAEAAKEIKSLIGASVERVESGARLVDAAGGTMEEIVASVQRVSDIIAEVSAATTEQSHDIGTVNTSVSQLEEMTQQNAALVEESAAAADSLQEQAGRLSTLVGRFQTGGSPGLAPGHLRARAGASPSAPAAGPGAFSQRIAKALQPSAASRAAAVDSAQAARSGTPVATTRPAAAAAPPARPAPSRAPSAAPPSPSRTPAPVHAGESGDWETF
jgi:methyl-accepting chemotaxis protein